MREIGLQSQRKQMSLSNAKLISSHLFPFVFVLFTDTNITTATALKKGVEQ